ncbi:MAG: chemotaxis protein CheA [Campylobacteraceae bacterium]|nr:chemotaxis protein CheA [Campylobacteraceae bacterium]
MDKKEKLLQIFIEEAHEIIEDLDRLTMELEDDEENVSVLVNDIFRGVHTLKGSANSFGYERLGEYVHYWEDLLVMFRDYPPVSFKNSIDLFFDSVSVIREMLNFEINKTQGYPSNYDETLKQIKQKIDNQENLDADERNNTNDLKVNEEIHFDLTYKVAPINDIEIESFTQEEKEEITKSLETYKSFYNIVLTFDDDLYFRGHNQQISINLLADIGTVVKSYWSFESLDFFEDYNNEHNYIKSISLYLSTNETPVDIEEIFEFSADDHEVKIRLFSTDEVSSICSVKTEVKEKEILKEENKPLTIETPKKSEIKKQSYIRIESSKIDELFNSVGEMVIAQSYIENSEVIQESNNVSLKKNINALSKSTKRVQDQVMSLRMVAIRDTFLKMKRIARDVSKKTGKEFDFIIKGEETEIDKTMVDALSDPLLHLIRNAIDHGLESSQERKKQGKPIGTVTLEAYHRGNNVVIEITDNGKGIDVNAILEKAISRGLVTDTHNLDESEIINFIFDPGFSMAKEISDISGRGVGLDVVKNSIDKLKGKIDIQTQLGEGSSFKIILPLTLAIIDGMIVSINEEIFILPTLSVVESFSPDMSQVSSVQGKEEFINFRGDVLPIVHLNRYLDIEGDEIEDKDSVFICMEHERGKFILRVDSIIGRQQVVVKSMGKFLNFVKEIVGGAILGDGKIALILNIEEIRDKLDK